MKTVHRQLFIAAAIACAPAFHTTAFAQSAHWDELSKLPFPGGYPAKETADRLQDELQFQRAC
jgi:hypothetical protein